MKRNVIPQRVLEGMQAARARGRNSARPRIMTAYKLRYARHLMADRTRAIPDLCRNLDNNAEQHAVSLPACRRHPQGIRQASSRGRGQSVAGSL